MARGKRRSKKQNAEIQPGGEGAKPKRRQSKPKNAKPDKPILEAKGDASTDTKQLKSISTMSMKDDSCDDESSARPSPSSDFPISKPSHHNGYNGSTDFSSKINFNRHGSPHGDHLGSVNRDDADFFDLEGEGSIKQVNGHKESSPQAMCDYCALIFENELTLKLHCQTEAHQNVVMSDGGRNWKCRPPPRGFTAAGYSLCENWNKTCKYGAQCVEAHSSLELQEWRERFEYRQNKIQQAEQQNLLEKSYTEQLLEKWSHTSNPDSVLKEKVDYVEDSVTENQLTTTISKDCVTDWTFLIKTTKTLQAVALLQYADRNRFAIKCVKSVVGGQHMEWVLEDTNEWLLPEEDRSSLENLPKQKTNPEFKHSICIKFLSDIYGTFRQAVAFDFGVEPLLVKHLCVDVRPASFATNVEELKKELFMDERWDESNAEIIKFSAYGCEPSYGVHSGAAELLRQYPTPTPSTFTLTQSTVTERMATKNNYCSRMHELLGVEEMARYQQVARFNVRAKLGLTKSYLLAPAGAAHSTAKYAQNDYLYAVMKLSQAISEDTAAGRLILSSCTSVLICAANSVDKAAQGSADSQGGNEKLIKKKVFEAFIEDKGKNVIYIKLSPTCVKEYNISDKSDFHAEVQFQLNRVQYCEWHHAVDSITNYDLLFPETFLEPDIPWTPQRQWNEIKDTKLNVKQKEAIVAITTPLKINLPPVLIIGPFGTGKTYTLAQAIKQLLVVPEHRILVCTHSNSAADIYIHDYLHPYVLDGHEAARPLRIYYQNRWVSTVQPTVQEYCLIETVNGSRRFRLPEKEDLEKHRVVVVTLNMSMVLATIGLGKGFFTHIFLDEAAQAMECEAIMPLAMAGEETRIVLAGDHMQLNPELFSPFAKERNLHMSLLERLYDHYPPSFPCKILLTENYRAHEAIIKFTSDLFYDQKLVSSGRQPKHPKYHPLTFYSCRGEDVQEVNSTGHYNLAEVYEIAERVTELRKSWPKEWGDLNDQSIGIMTPYADQVFRIRCELRRKKLGSISVERVLNVQGKQFRAIFISTVRTRRTCSGTKSGCSEESEFGFLSNSKLLNTAITRAQSLVAVVGDPIALCSLGRCRKVWEHYIKTCDKNSSLFGIPWSTIQAHLDGVEFKHNYGLNPLAPEFIPMGYNSMSCRAGISQENPHRNDSYVFKGYHSHLTFFDQNSPDSSQPANSRQANFRRQGPRPLPPHSDGDANINQPSYGETAQSQQQCYGAYQVKQPQANAWSLLTDTQSQSIVLQNQTCLISNCKFQGAPEMIQSSTSLCGPVHYNPHSQRVWPGSTHVLPSGGAIATNPNSPSGGTTTPGGSLIMRVPGVAGLNSSNVSGGPFQSMSGSAAQHIEFQSYPSQQVVQPVQQLPQQIVAQSTNQAFLGSRQIMFPVQPQFMLHQITPQVANQGMPNSVLPQQAIQNPHYVQIQPNGLVQQPTVQNVQNHQVGLQCPQILIQNQQQLRFPHQQLQQPQQKPEFHLQMQQQQQQQLHHRQHMHQQQIHHLQIRQQEIQQQQIQHQPILQQQQNHQQNHQQYPLNFVQYQQQAFAMEHQLRLQQEQQWQQLQHLAMLLEQRKMLLGHVLTPLVNCNPLWNKLIPRGVNLLDLVDNKSQQEEWWTHLMANGRTDLAKRFSNFMALCVRTVAAVFLEAKQAPLSTFVSRSQLSDLNAEEVSDGAAALSNGHDVSHQSGSLRTSLNREGGNTGVDSENESEEQVIMMKDLDPTYMLGSDPILNGGKSVWAIAQDELEHCNRNGSKLKNQSKSMQKSSSPSETYDSDDSA